jgi:hypothetical protein
MGSVRGTVLAGRHGAVGAVLRVVERRERLRRGLDDLDRPLAGAVMERAGRRHEPGALSRSE